MNNKIIVPLEYKIGVSMMYCQVMMLAQNNVVNIIAHNHGIPPSEVELNHFRDSYMPFSRSEEVRQ
jgi:hypothetical protein